MRMTVNNFLTSVWRESSERKRQRSALPEAQFREDAQQVFREESLTPRAPRLQAAGMAIPTPALHPGLGTKCTQQSLTASPPDPPSAPKAWTHLLTHSLYRRWNCGNSSHPTIPELPNQRAEREAQGPGCKPRRRDDTARPAVLRMRAPDSLGMTCAQVRPCSVRRQASSTWESADPGLLPCGYSFFQLSEVESR